MNPPTTIVAEVSPGGNSSPSLTNPSSDSAAGVLLRGLAELRDERNLAVVRGRTRYVATLDALIDEAWRTWRRVAALERQWTYFTPELSR